MTDDLIVQSECEVCEGDCYRDALHSLSPLAVLIDRMEWPHTHGRIELVQGHKYPWIAQQEGKRPRSVTGETRSAALRRAVAACLGEGEPDDDLGTDPLAVQLDALPEWSPYDRIVLRRDQLHIYVYIGKHFGGHGLAEALYNMIRITTKERV